MYAHTWKCMFRIGSTANVKHTNEPRVRRMTLARIGILLAFRVGCHRDSAQKEGIHEMP